MEFFTHRRLITELLRKGIIERIVDPDTKGSYNYLFRII